MGCRAWDVGWWMLDMGRRTQDAVTQNMLLTCRRFVLDSDVWSNTTAGCLSSTLFFSSSIVSCLVATVLIVITFCDKIRGLF